MFTFVTHMLWKLLQNYLTLIYALIKKVKYTLLIDNMKITFIPKYYSYGPFSI